MRKSFVLLAAIVTAAAIKAQTMELKNLDPRERSIAAVAAHTATGNTERLKSELGRGLEAGLTIGQMREVMVQLYAYCGFPRSLNAINAFMEVLEARKAQGIEDVEGRAATPVADDGDKYKRGKLTLQALTGFVEGEPSGANAFAPRIDRFLKEHLFADIFDSDVLTHRERELATVSALAAMTGVAPQLAAHLGLARNAGLTEAELQDAQLIGALAGVEQRGGVFAQGDRGPGEWFTGTVWVQPLVASGEVEELYSVGQVTFEPGGRTLWHTHPAGQVLLVTGGRGFYQERGKAARPLAAGDVVAIPKDVEHWHGAARDSRFVHIAISNVHDGSAVTWTSPVTETEYRQANR